MTLNLANLSPSLARIGRVRLYRSVAIAGRDGVHDVVVEGRRIVGIGTFARDEFPEGTVDIDAAGLTLSPGRAGGGTIADGTTTRIVSSLAGSAVSSGASGEMQNLATAVPPTDGPDPRGVIREHAIADLVLEDLLQNEGAPGRVCEVLVAGQVAYPAGQHNAGEIVLPLVARDDSVIPRVQRIGDCGHDRVRFGVVTGEAAGGVRALLGEADCDGVSVTTQVAAGAAEGVRIVVASDGVTLSAGSPAGLVRAAAALDQLRDADRTAPTGQWDADAPAYSWRGLMLDVARHFRPVSDVERILLLMARHRLNVLHLHLTDDQGWRYEVPGYPRLATVGATRAETQRGHGPQSAVVIGEHSGFYTRADLERIVAYADALHITVVPEVEFPGHVQAAIAAYPDLATTGDVPTTPWPRFGLNPHTLNLRPETLEFCRAAIAALVDVFPSRWIGVGGDEVPTAQWAADDVTRERMAELGIDDVHGVQPWFTSQLVSIVEEFGRAPFAWDEVLAGPIDPSLLVGIWRGHVAARAARRRGHDFIWCSDLEAYLDYRQGEGADEPIPVGPPLTVEDTWRFTVPEGARGGQANVWTEHLPTRDRVDFAFFPRLAVIAERLWAGGEPGEWNEFARLLPTHVQRLEEWGVSYRPFDGPRPDQRVPGVPGVPRSREERERIVAGLVADIGDV
ncbi:family 20 glycosylhydrolase [Microbacterium sp. NC79]|uniref:beta-N-acetylhexosaminidase n=1 Tax=Microbacterium sp. NC79 TaxID=2851009 RepID=UPI001C2C9D6B|nr:family 20 glycosylhydrolase [Microbacterium sp. NC79]